MNITIKQKYQEYVIQMQKIADLGAAASVLSWDNEVNIPSGSHNLRAKQLATLSGVIHGLTTDKKFGKLLRDLAKEDLPLKHRRNIAFSLKEYDKNFKFSQEFVVKKTMAIAEAFHAWSEAKTKADFTIFAPSLDKLLAIVREEVRIVGYEHHPYDTMLDNYEPELTVTKLDKIFGQVKSQLVPFIQQIKPQGDKKLLHQHFPKDKQWAFGLDLLKSIGFNFEQGRQDISSHPFTISFGSEDVRLTTRVDEQDFANMTWSCIHEGGHGMYEQGLPAKEYGLPSGTYASLAIHESQSRLWENNIGRSKFFWQYHYPRLKKIFPAQFQGTSLQQFYLALNIVKKNHIRTEADELHYHLHVLIRYEIEKEILSSSIKAKDIKELWNEHYKNYVGVKIKNDREGILQDVHWSHGSFGYFPTYSLGSFYAAQFFAKIKSIHTDVENKIAKGDYSQVHTWLKDNIYKHGRTYTAEELCKKATGSGLDFGYFMSYVERKYGG
jgi:carboxypeptidase Taq